MINLVKDSRRIYSGPVVTATTYISTWFSLKKSNKPGSLNKLTEPLSPFVL